MSDRRKLPAEDNLEAVWWLSEMDQLPSEDVDILPWRLASRPLQFTERGACLRYLFGAQAPRLTWAWPRFRMSPASMSARAGNLINRLGAFQRELAEAPDGDLDARLEWLRRLEQAADDDFRRGGHRKSLGHARLVSDQSDQEGQGLVGRLRMIFQRPQALLNRLFRHRRLSPPVTGRTVAWPPEDVQ